MTEVSPKVYEITYTDLDAFDNYQVKFAANGSWAANRGDTYGGSGVETQAKYNSSDNITFEVPYKLADVTLRLDLSNYDHTTKTGATFTVTLVEHHDHVFTDTWEKNDTYHWHKCQFENCTRTKDKAEHSIKPATCTSKAVCGDCGEEYGEVDSSNHDLEKIPAKAATVTESGNIEYWQCKDCGDIFSDEDGKSSIGLEDTVTQKLPPEIIEGKGQSLIIGEKKGLTFRSNAAFSDFKWVGLDGKSLDKKNYTIKEGSTIVTLKADYVGALSTGEHTIGIVSTSGTADTIFTVQAKPAADNDTADHNTAKPTADNNTKSPQDGDNSHMTLWIALLFVSGALLTVTGICSKKKKYNR